MFLMRLVPEQVKIADLFIPHDSGGELGLGLGEAGPGAAVHAVDLKNRRVRQLSNYMP